MTNATPELKAKEVERRYGRAKKAERLDWPADGPCAASGLGQQHEIRGRSGLAWHPYARLLRRRNYPGFRSGWSQIVTGDTEETRVNLAFNRDSPLVKSVSCLPHRGELNMFVKSARRVLVRVPEWAQKSDVKAFVNKEPKPLLWEGSSWFLRNRKKTSN